MTSIVRFAGKYRFLSNFYSSEVEYEGEVWPTVEHAYQAAKNSDPEYRKWMREAETPAAAKKLGANTQLRKDWEDVKVAIMADLVSQKFNKHPDLTKALLSTEDAHLIEGNNWGDRFWGVCNGTGENWLGKILMNVRRDLKKDAASEAA